MAEKKEAPKAEVPEWVVTFGDLMSLLLCFFVLLVSFSEMKKPREYQKVIDSVNEALGFKGGMGLAHLIESANNSMVSSQEERARRDSDKQSTDQNDDPNVQGRQTLVNVVQEGARHAIGGSIMFEVGSFELSKRNQDMLRDTVAPKIRGLNYICPIVGHAWGLEEKRSGLTFDELGYRRAQVIKDFLVRECGVDAAILRIESAGDTEPMSLSDASNGGGQAGGSNRRVQVYQTGRTVSQTHPDPNFTGAGN